MSMSTARSALIAVLGALLLAPVAGAASNGPVFGLRAAGNPKLGYFVYSLAPGATRTGGIIVSNTGNRAGTVKLYAADATTGRTTGTVYLTDTGAARTGAYCAAESGSSPYHTYSNWRVATRNASRSGPAGSSSR